MPYALVIHGGAGARPGTDYAAQTGHLTKLIARGQTMLNDGDSGVFDGGKADHRFSSSEMPRRI